MAPCSVASISGDSSMDETKRSLSRFVSGLGGGSLGAPEGEEGSAAGREAMVACSSAPSHTPACARGQGAGGGGGFRVRARSGATVRVRGGWGAVIARSGSSGEQAPGRAVHAHPAQRPPAAQTCFVPRSSPHP
eukprot:scaffold23671_cov86-Isochrysis_galbana.AAC.1